MYKQIWINEDIHKVVKRKARDNNMSMRYYFNETIRIYLEKIKIKLKEDENKEELELVISPLESHSITQKNVVG